MDIEEKLGEGCERLYKWKSVGHLCMSIEENWGEVYERLNK